MSFPEFEVNYPTLLRSLHSKDVEKNQQMPICSVEVSLYRLRFRPPSTGPLGRQIVDLLQGNTG